MKIYTKTGDDGTTSLFAGGRVSKHHLRVDAYGTVDELNSAIGVVRVHNPTRRAMVNLEIVQNHLFRLGSDLATPMDHNPEWLLRIDEPIIEWLEADIDDMSQNLEPLKNFILPGGGIAGAHLHLARTICRRAERLTVALSEQEAVNPASIRYLNRLSDWLFTLARMENRHAGIPEEKWQIHG